MDDLELLNKQTKISKKHFPLIIEGVNGDVEIEVTPKAPKDLPPGAELKSTAIDIAESLFRLKDNIAVVSEQVKQALAEHQPEEWAVEFNIGFKTEGGIPFIAKGEANTALKITAKWKKGTS